MLTNKLETKYCNFGKLKVFGIWVNIKQICKNFTHKLLLSSWYRKKYHENLPAVKVSDSSIYLYFPLALIYNEKFHIDSF